MTAVARCQSDTNKELQRCLADLHWRVHASEQAIQRKFEPSRVETIPRRRIDETETALDRNPESVAGMVVRYAPRLFVEADLVGDEVAEEHKPRAKKKEVPKGRNGK